MEDVKEGSGFVRSRFVVRRAEDSCLRTTCDVELSSDGRRNGRVLTRGRRGTMIFMSLLSLVQLAPLTYLTRGKRFEAQASTPSPPGPVQKLLQISFLVGRSRTALFSQAKSISQP